AVRLLRIYKIIDPAADGVRVPFAGGHETDEGPGGLRGGRRALAGGRGVVVAMTALSPGPRRLLHFFEPGDRSPHHGVFLVEVDGIQAQQDLPGAIDVIDAPAAEPTAAPILCFL